MTVPESKGVPNTVPQSMGTPMTVPENMGVPITVSDSQPLSPLSALTAEDKLQSPVFPVFLIVGISM